MRYTFCCCRPSPECRNVYPPARKIKRLLTKTCEQITRLVSYRTDVGGYIFVVDMTSEKPSKTIPFSAQTGRHVSPSPVGLRHRPLGRASTFAEGPAQLNRRRSSFLSETLSETRKSLRSSTDDILLPRARRDDKLQDQDEASHWHSLPLVLALLPAIGGIFFKDGSAFITDVTLLALAAIFMNWALKSPWCALTLPLDDIYLLTNT